MDNPNATNEPAGALPPVPPSAISPDPVAPPEPNPSLSDWLKRNGPSLVVLAALLVFLYARFDVEGLWSIVKAAIGLGLVIFVHELGHFAVAKWCDVHVETFSIGFGPALPGCKWQRGETTYMIALFPLGGYVKMVGEGSESEEGDEDPRSFKNKSVWQRMAIISAGVVMNVLMAFICFIVVFRGPGKDQNAGVIGQVEAGSPAWKMGIPAGAQPHRIGDVEDPFFGDLLPVVMNSSPNEELDLVYSLPPSTKRIHLKIVARKLASDDRPVIGVAPAERCVLPPQRYYKGRRLPVYLQSAAARAEPPFEFDDEVIGCTDPEKRKPGDWKDDWTPLPEDPRNNQKFQPDFFELSRRLQLLIDEDVTIRVKRKKGSEVSIRVPRAYHSTFGVRMQMGQIAALRDGSPAAKKLKPAPPGDGKKKEGDIIEQVEVTEPSGNVTRFLFPRKDAVHPRQPGLEIDPSRLHFELRQWAARCDLGVKKNGKKIDKIVTLKVRRDNTDNGAQYIPTTARIKWDDNPVWKFTREVPYSLTSPTAIAELGIAFRITNIVNGVDPPTKRQGLRSGDVIKRFRLWVINKEGEEEQRSWQDLDRDQWPHIAWIMQTSTDVKKLTVQIDRDEEEIVLTAREDKTWPLADRGILFLPDLRVKRADNIGDAVLMGLQDTKKTIIQIYQNLQGMITGRISYKNLGGPVRIARFAYDIAGENFWDFVFFLGLIGINLAVVNFLPIPVLDGGHMVFLIYEKIRGKPASEQVRTVATIIGLLFIVSLFIFVTYLDISRIFR